MTPARPASLVHDWKADVPASLVVFLVALPLCLGIALASGAPLLAGLIAGVIGGLVVGPLSGSALGVSGPAAGLAVIVAGAIVELGSYSTFLVAVVLAGVIQIALGFAGAGFIAYFFPSSVITGMLTGIGVIIFLKQIPHAFGYDRDPVGEMAFKQPDGETTFTELSHIFDSVSSGPMIIAFVSLVILLAWETKKVKQHGFLSLVPGPLLAVIAGSILHVLFQSSEALALSPAQLVQVPVAEGFSEFGRFLSFPDFSGFTQVAVYKTAIVLAIVASLETLLCVEAADKLDVRKRVTPTNRELKAQGVGNVVSGLIGGLPITQVIVRSSANAQSGARTKLSAILHGGLLAGSVIALPTVMNLIPLATLAAILLVIGYKLAKPALFKKMVSEGPGQFLPFFATVSGIVFTDLLSGIFLGLTVAIIVILYESYRLPFQMAHEADHDDGRVHITLAQQVTFLNKARLLNALERLAPDSSVTIDARRSAFVHHDAVEIIENFRESAPQRGIDLIVKGLEPHYEKCFGPRPEPVES